jgi:predicted nucleotidyltransferase
MRAVDCPMLEEGRLNIPDMGSSMPKMGIQKRPSKQVSRQASLADALFSRTQQGVLGLLFGQPDRSSYATEIIGRLRAGSGAVQRELSRLESSGLVTVTRIGTQKHFQANPASPLFGELTGIAQKTVGLAEPIRAALHSLLPRLDAAFVFGSVAKRADTALSDIDLMIIGNELEYADVFSALEPAGNRLGRTINPTIYSRAEWKRRLKQGNAFVTRVAAQPKLWIHGSNDVLGT